jgi:ABC-type uncharacterized transport system permease subunit
MSSTVLAARLREGSLTAASVAAAVLVALALGAIVIGAAGADPLVAYRGMVQGAVGDGPAFQRLLVGMTPLVLLALGYAIAFRVRLFTIGAQGGYDLGGIAAGWLVLSLDFGPGWVGIVLALGVAMIAGALIALVVGALYTRYSVNPVITSLMLNYLVLYVLAWVVRVPLRNPNGFTPESAPVPDDVVLPHLGTTLIHPGVLLALVAVPLVMWLSRRTRWGFASLVVGLNESAARATGTSVARTVLVAAGLSGALSGLAGGIALLGTELRLSGGFHSSIGFTAIVVALLGRSSPVGIVLAAALIQGLTQGGTMMQTLTQVPSAVSVVLQTLVVLLVLLMTRWRERA